MNINFLLKSTSDAFTLHLKKTRPDTQLPWFREGGWGQSKGQSSIWAEAVMFIIPHYAKKGKSHKWTDYSKNGLIDSMEKRGMLLKDT